MVDEKRIYICDQRADCCWSLNCGRSCTHTADINHAKYQDHVDFKRDCNGIMWEVERGDMNYSGYRNKVNIDSLCQWFDVMFCSALKHPEDNDYKRAVFWISEALTTAELITPQQRDAIMEVIKEKG